VEKLIELASDTSIRHGAHQRTLQLDSCVTIAAPAQNVGTLTHAEAPCAVAPCLFAGRLWLTPRRTWPRCLRWCRWARWCDSSMYRSGFRTKGADRDRLVRAGAAQRQE
jgi:hypothetical protein